jgi:hypothetical protein
MRFLQHGILLSLYSAIDLKFIEALSMTIHVGDSKRDTMCTSHRQLQEHIASPKTHFEVSQFNAD